MSLRHLGNCRWTQVEHITLRRLLETGLGSLHIVEGISLLDLGKHIVVAYVVIFKDGETGSCARGSKGRNQVAVVPLIYWVLEPSRVIAKVRQITAKIGAFGRVEVRITLCLVKNHQRTALLRHRFKIGSSWEIDLWPWCFEDALTFGLVLTKDGLAGEPGSTFVPLIGLVDNERLPFGAQHAVNELLLLSFVGFLLSSRHRHGSRLSLNCQLSLVLLESDVLSKLDSWHGRELEDFRMKRL